MKSKCCGPLLTSHGDVSPAERVAKLRSLLGQLAPDSEDGATDIPMTECLVALLVVEAMVDNYNRSTTAASYGRIHAAAVELRLSSLTQSVYHLTVQRCGYYALPAIDESRAHNQAPVAPQLARDAVACWIASGVASDASALKDAIFETIN